MFRQEQAVSKLPVIRFQCLVVRPDSGVRRHYAAFMPYSDILDQLEGVEYLYLSQLSEPRDNSLRIVVEEAILNKGRVAEPPSPELQHLFENSHPIESTAGCRTFELFWNRYAAYCVTEELVGSNARTGYDDESYTGTILRAYTKSHFLDHILRDTGGHLGAVQHWKIICLNHLIDVAAYDAPQITALGRRDGRVSQ